MHSAYIKNARNSFKHCKVTVSRSTSRINERSNACCFDSLDPRLNGKEYSYGILAFWDNSWQHQYVSVFACYNTIVVSFLFSNSQMLLCAYMIFKLFFDFSLNCTHSIHTVTVRTISDSENVCNLKNYLFFYVTHTSNVEHLD